MNSPPVVHLRLFGSPSLWSETGTLLSGRVAQRHRLALLALLAVAGDRGSSREWLAAHLWPESDRDRARNLLNVSVYIVRQALGEDAVLSQHDDLRLNSAVVATDVGDFGAALERRDHEHAVALYRAPFLEGFFLPDTPEFERWVERERSRFHGEAGRALEALAEASEGEEDLARAEEWWKARAALDPYDSRVALRVMRVLDAGGNRPGALQHAAIHQRLLEAEFGTAPDPEVLALAERLRSEPAAVEAAAAPRRPPATSLADPPRPPPAPPSVQPSASPSASASAAASPPDTKRFRRRRSHVVGAAVLLLTAAVAAGGRAWWNGRPGPPAPLRPSIAVLPLVTDGGDPGDAALARGITEEVSTLLARDTALRVVASAAFTELGDRRLDPRQIADSLGVDYVLAGGLQRIGSTRRVRMRLVDGRTGVLRWSDKQDRNSEDLFAVMDDIARSVTRELGTRVGGGAATPVARGRPRSIAAYELYMRGTDRSLMRSDSAAREGLALLQRALALDSTYAAAWAGMARVYGRLGPGVSVTERQRYYALADQAALRAVALDDSLAEAHASLGVMRMRSFDFASAENHLRRAIELDPTAASNHEFMVTALLSSGRPREALAEAERALDLDPLSPNAHAEVARALLGNDRCPEALDRLDRLAGLQPPLLRASMIAASCYERMKMRPEAVAAVRPLAERGEPLIRAYLGYLLGRAGRGAEARQVLATLLQADRGGAGVAFEIALVYAGLGEVDEAFLWLDRAREDRSLVGIAGGITHLVLSGPSFEELRSDPRFPALRARLGFQKR